jgi:hypothetical protein
MLFAGSLKFYPLGCFYQLEKIFGINIMTSLIYNSFGSSYHSDREAED